MNLKNVILIFLFVATTPFAQTASSFFPAQQGYKWYFESVPLDSLNNPVTSQKFYAIDSFAVVAPFYGKNANIVLTKTGALNTINFQPYLDSLFYSFETSNGFEYFDPVNVAGLLGNLDTTLGINFFNFFNSLEGWYSYYRFSSNLNQSYQVYKKDTTITIDSTSLPIRFELIGKKLSDEILNTAIGTFTCKKFLLERRLSYLVSIPPFPSIAIKILGVEESIWFAPDKWRVKSYIPSTNVDLSILGIPAFNVPGLETSIMTPITNIEESYEVIKDFELHQNYPNPFNPSTIIKWQSPVNSHQTLKIYDILGNELATLVDEYRAAGDYQIEFNSVSSFKNQASGIYFYQLQAGDFIQTKKMILLK